MEKPISVIDMFKDMAEGLFVDKQAEEDLELEMGSQLSRLRKVRQALAVPTETNSSEKRNESLLLHHRLGKRSRLIAYTKCGGWYHKPEMQRDVILEYADKHGYVVSEFYDFDSAYPASNLGLAIDALMSADGLIVSDLNRLVEHCQDPARGLLPMIHDNFFHNDRYLISVHENINTSTVHGQNALLQYLHQLLRAA